MNRKYAWPGVLLVLVIALAGCTARPAAAPSAGTEAAPAAPADLGAPGSIPPGWQVLKAEPGECQFAAPPGWKAMPGQPAAIDTQTGSSASLSPNQGGQGSWESVKQALRAPYDGFGTPSVLLDDGTRYWLLVGDKSKRMNVYLGALRGEPNTCIVVANVPEQVARTAEPTVREILNSVDRAR